MDTAFDQLVAPDAESTLIVTHGYPVSLLASEKTISTSSENFILDLSQRPITEVKKQSHSIIVINNWHDDSPCFCTDNIDEDLTRPLLIDNEKKFNIKQSLTDQVKCSLNREHSWSDNSQRNQSKLDLYQLMKKSNSSPSHTVTMHEIEPCLTFSRLSSSNFVWSKYLSWIGERSVSGEFFDHYLASIESGFAIEMKLEYCYDLQHDLHWLTQIQLVSHCLLLLHYVGLPDDDTSHDFWADIYEQRCHPIGWCKENSKLMLPPPILTKRVAQPVTSSNHSALNVTEQQTATTKTDPIHSNEGPSRYLFDKEIGLTPVEQLKKGMLLELQDIRRPWTLWFVRVMNNRGGRLQLRYITSINNDNEPESDVSSSDTHIFYLDRRVHPIGWTSNAPSIYSYEIPTDFKFDTDKDKLIGVCLTTAKAQFLPPNLFKEQEETVKHRFIEGMKLEVFESKSQQVHIGRIGRIHNDHYFDVIIDIDNENVLSFIAHSTHPHILPAHWAAEHKLALMDGQGIRQSEDYWSLYTEKNGISDLASERCFSLITLNAAGNNRMEPGMKMEMICTINNEDHVFSVTLVHVADHLMWLRVDDTSLYKDQMCLYRVLPINSLDLFPVGWAKFNEFDLIKPVQYEIQVKKFEQDRFNLFSSVTHYPKIPHVFLNEIYLITIYVNVQCFCGPHICASRLTRIPSKFGPGSYRHVLIDMYHFFLSTLSATAHRALRRLDHSSNNEVTSNLKTESVKVAKRSSKLIRQISVPIEPRVIHHYLRHVCTQLEACPNLISIQHIDKDCPDQCHTLSNTFVCSPHSKHKRTQLRFAQNRYRKQKSLLCHLNNASVTPNVLSPSVEEISSTADIQLPTVITNDSLPPAPISLPGSDRQTRGFRVHIERKTHTVTRTNRKNELIEVPDTLSINGKQESIEINQSIPDLPSSSSSSSSASSSSTITTTNHSAKESKRSSTSKRRRCPSPPSTSTNSATLPVTLNILPLNSNPSSLSNKAKKRRPIPAPHSLNDLKVSALITPKMERQMSPPQMQSLQYPIPPPVDPKNPITWNVNDVCWYLNESGCSFALKTIKEQEIDGAALLLLDDLNTVQDLLEFKLGPAVKFCHVVEQLRTQVIDKFHSSPSLKASSRLSRN